MFKLDFSDIQNNGFRINQLRLIHSNEFRGGNFEKEKNRLSDLEDLAGERDIISNYIIESMEINFTLYKIFAGMTFVSFFLLVLTIFIPLMSLFVNVIPLILTFVFWLLAKKRKEDFVMGSVGLRMSESIYNFKMGEKYNLK